MEYLEQGAKQAFKGEKEDMTEEGNHHEHPPRRHRRLQANQIVEADLEEESLTANWLPSGRLVDNDLLSYISVYFSDEQTTMNCRVNASTMPELNRNGILDMLLRLKLF